MKKILLPVLLALVCTTGAHAEKADADKGTFLEADQTLADTYKQVSTVSGNVVLTRGTLIIKADNAVATKDPAGNDFVRLTAAPGKLVTFRQKRDGGDLWTEGQAERIDYDGKTEIVQFFSKGRIKQLTGTKPTDEVEGDFLSYNSRTEIFSANAKTSGEKIAGSGRVKITLQHEKAKDGGK